LPGREFIVGGMAVHQDLGYSVRVALGLLEHGKLIGVDGLVFVDCGLDVPAGEVSAIAAGEGACSHAADGDSLPVTIVDVRGVASYAGVVERLTQGTLPGGRRNLGLGKRSRHGDEKNSQQELRVLEEEVLQRVALTSLGFVSN
jgi:hypothetical protein